MWVHILIFLLLPIVFIGWKTGFLPQGILGNRQGRKLFFLLAVIGNFIGLFLTIEDQKEREAFREYRLLKREDSSYEEKFRVYTEGGEESLYVQIPQKESEQETSFLDIPLSKEEQRQKELKDALALYNQEKNDDEYYYLPEEIDGKKVRWEKEKDTSGSFLAGLFFLAAVSLMLLKSREEANLLMKRREEMLLEYPGLIMKFTLLVQAGMPARKAFQKIALDYRRKRKKKIRYAYEEIIVMCYEMETGVSEAEAYRKFGERCDQVKYKTLATLLIQNLQKGSRHLADMLEKESMEAWDERKRKARVLGESAATKLLLPMVLMLMIVMVIIMVPACISFYGGM